MNYSNLSFAFMKQKRSSNSSKYTRISPAKMKKVTPTTSKLVRTPKTPGPSTSATNKPVNINKPVTIEDDTFNIGELSSIPKPDDDIDNDVFENSDLNDSIHKLDDSVIPNIPLESDESFNSNFQPLEVDSNAAPSEPPTIESAQLETTEEIINRIIEIDERPVSESDDEPMQGTTTRPQKILKTVKTSLRGEFWV